MLTEIDLAYSMASEMTATLVSVALGPLADGRRRPRRVAKRIAARDGRRKYPRRNVRVRLRWSYPGLDELATMEAWAC